MPAGMVPAQNVMVRKRALRNAMRQAVCNCTYERHTEAAVEPAHTLARVRVLDGAEK